MTVEAVAAAESAIGLSILVAYYRVRGTISVKYINLLNLYILKLSDKSSLVFIL